MALRPKGSQARRQPKRRVDLPAAPVVRHQLFEELVESALDGLPAGMRKLLENVAVVIEDAPSPEQLKRSGLRPYATLYGLYEGISPVTYGADMFPVANKITIFRLPLEADFPDPQDLAREVQRTVLHEIGHHAGMSEPRLHSVGY